MVKYTPISGIYLILNTKNNKVYIGQAEDIRKRWGEHKRSLKNNKHDNQHLQHAYNKYGDQSFKYKILEYCEIEKLNEREQHYLDVYIPKGICYNIAINAEISMRGYKHTLETRLKMSEAAKLRPPPSEETRRKISEAGKGRIHTEKARKKMSEAQVRKIITDETRHKMSEARKKRPPPSEETRRKLSESGKLRYKKQRENQVTTTE
jgi:group I intron endonuclease